MSTALYLVGIVVLICGLLYIGHITHMHQSWMIGLSILILGAGLVGAATSTRQKDPN